MSRSRNRPVLLVALLLVAVLAAVAWRITTPAPAPIALPDETLAAAAAPVETALEPGGDSASRATPPPREEHEASRPPAPAAPRADTAGRIEGRVVRRDESPAPTGTLVLATTSETFDADPARAARCDADGRFALSGLPPGLHYVHAAGNGYITPVPVAVADGATDAKVVVSLLYGVAVLVRESGGAPLRTKITQGNAGPPSSGLAAPLLDGPLADLAGADLSPYRDGPGRSIFLFTSRRTPEPARLESVRLLFRYLGYSAADTAFDALPILPAIPEHTVEVQPTASGFGEIVVRFDDARDPTGEGPRQKPFRLQIASSTGYQAEIELPRDTGAKRIQGIPFARYKVTVLNALDQQILPRLGLPVRPVEVGPAPALLAVPLSGTCELAIEVRRGASPAYDGPGVFAIGRGEPTPDGKGLVGPTGTVVFDHGPYVLRGLIPGHYILFVKEPAGAIVEVACPNGRFEIEPDGARTVGLELP